MLTTPRGDDSPIAPDDAGEQALLDAASDAVGAREEADWLDSLTPDERALYHALLGAYQRDWLDQLSEAEHARWMAEHPEELARIEATAAPERPVAPPLPIDEPDF
jgi:hypothetical protein